MIDSFAYNLERNLALLHNELAAGKYVHGKYSTFIVNENKRREISVAHVRDRVVHRVLYEYLVPIFDKTFIYDVWSCRKGKGLMAAIERAQDFVFRYKESYVWRSDVTKYFDNIVHDKILELIKRRVKDTTAIKIIDTVLRSYKVSEYTENGNTFKKGVPIGNLTSQIFSNIYLNEFDRYVKHILKPQAYMRYGDDFLIILKDKNELLKVRELCKNFLEKELKLELNPKNDIVVKVKHGIYFLGAEIFPKGRRLRKRNWDRAKTRINRRNIPSYRGLVMQNSSVKKQKEFNWRIFEMIESEIKSELRIKGKGEKREKE